ncbi:MAG: hypothetical protein WC840_03135 [Candidatus Peribacteraceae bacterium]
MLYSSKLFLVILSAAIFLLADSLSANWGKNGSVLSLVLMCIVGSVGYFLFGLLNQKVQLGVAGGLVNVILVVGTVIVGWMYFGESLMLRQYVGLVLAGAAILLLS